MLAKAYEVEEPVIGLVVYPERTNPYNKISPIKGPYSKLQTLDFGISSYSQLLSVAWFSQKQEVHAFTKSKPCVPNPKPSRALV